jgi:hypothetical protein
MQTCPFCAELIPDSATVCAHCQHDVVSGVVIAQRTSLGKKSGVAGFFWIVAQLSAVLGGLVGIGGSFLANGAPQEAAAAAMGCIIVIAPYVFARAVSELTR